MKPEVSKINSSSEIKSSENSIPKNTPVQNITLRPYQREMLREVWVEVQRTKTLSSDQRPSRVACVQPTGAGKTVEIITLANQLAKDNWRTLVVVPTRKLVSQTIEKIEMFYPELSCGTVSEGKWKCSEKNNIVVATAAGIAGKKLKKFLPTEFELVIIDEAHHALSDSYTKILKYFSGAMIQIGLTATFRRGDGASILSNEYFSTLLCWQTVAQLTEQGYLAPARGQLIYTETNLSKVKKKKGGDFDERALAKAVDTPERNTLAVEGWKKHAVDQSGKWRKTVAFTVNISHARHLAEEFNARGISAAAVWGRQNEKEQKRIFDDYRSGKITVLTNAMLLTEGWDEPSISCVLIARPATTASSFVLGPQMIGRGLRLFPGKTDAVIIELRDQTSDEGTAEDSMLAATFEIDEKDISNNESLHIQKQKSDGKKALEEIEYLAGQIGHVEFASEFFNVIEKLERTARMAWLPLGSRLFMSISGDDFMEICEEQPGRFALKLCEKGRLRTLKIAPTRERLISYGEGWLIRERRDHTFVRRDAEWRKKPPTGAAISMAGKLTGRSKTELEKMNRGEISDLINAARQLDTLKTIEH